MNVGITVSDKKLQIFVMEIVVCMGISFHRQLETRKNITVKNIIINSEEWMNVGNKNHLVVIFQTENVFEQKHYDISPI